MNTPLPDFAAPERRAVINATLPCNDLAPVAGPWSDDGAGDDDLRAAVEQAAEWLRAGAPGRALATLERVIS